MKLSAGENFNLEYLRTSDSDGSFWFSGRDLFPATVSNEHYEKSSFY